MTCFQKLSCGSSQIRIKALDRELQIFNYFIERVMEKICARNELRIPPSKLALKAALYASLEIAP